MKTLRLFFPLLICLLNLVSAAAVVLGQPKATASTAQQQSVTAEMRKQASDFYQRQEWASAAEAYAAMTRVEPLNPGAWARRGVALHALGKYSEAVAAFERSLEINSQQPMTLFNLARSFSRLNDRNKALETLERAVEIGYGQPEMLKKDEDLARLRDDARFLKALSAAEVNLKPCSARPEYRQLDFWIGEWDVKATLQEQAAGTSSIQLILGDCVIFENWTGAGSMTGKSFSFFDRAAGKWQQRWVDDKGGVLEFSGEYRDNAMRFTATTTLKGQKALQRMTLFNLSQEQMRQLGEQSTDEGKTWSVMYDLTYTRRRR
jgi:tetratricopeptide (TPR) repeat protein